MMRLILLALILAALPAYGDSYTPATYNLTIQQGEDFSKTLSLSDANKLPLNLTGYAFRAQVRSTPTSPAVMLNISTVVNAGAGTVQLRARKALTGPLANKTGYWDLLMTLPDGSTSYLLKGQFLGSPTVTR